MQYSVVILSEDRIFARMLELEFSSLRLGVLSASSLHDEDRGEVVILDLDSASPPPTERYGKLIGFSRHPATATEDARSCSMILRRPFQVSLLRREVLALLGEERGVEPLPRESASRRLRLDAEKRLLWCEGERVSLSPCEVLLMQALMETRGQVMSREDLTRRIGESGGNKTDVYICYLRRKTDGLPGGRLIQTVRKKGYRIE